MFDILQLDPDFDQNEAIDFFQVPHYSNEHRHTTSEPFHFRFRQLTPHPDDLKNVYNVVVIWQDRGEPTDKELCALIRSGE